LSVATARSTSSSHLCFFGVKTEWARSRRDPANLLIDVRAATIWLVGG
jgi:hypothetical protein